MIFLSFLIGVVVLVASYFIWKNRKWLVMYSKIHREPWNIPGVGSAFGWLKNDEVRMNVLKRFGRIAIKQGGLSGLWIGPTYFVVISDAALAELVLKRCLEKGNLFNFVSEFLGNGSLFSPVHIWRPRRKVIAPNFSVKNLNQFMEIFYRQSSNIVEQLKGSAGRGTFSMWKYITAFTFGSVCETTLGVKVDAHHQSNSAFMKAFDQYCVTSTVILLIPPIVQDIYKYLTAYKHYLNPIHYMWNFVDNIIKDKRKELVEKEQKSLECKNDPKETPTELKTILELMIQTSGGASGFTNLELREEALVLLLAGTDTSAVGSAFACLMLARHPDVQEKVYEEIKEVLGDSDSPITPADLPRLKYLDAVIRESLRLYPSVPTVIRQVDQDIQLPTGLTLVKGTTLLVNIWAIHRNPKYWGQDAEEFKPDRFIGSTLSHPAAFIAFSHGPRGCLGYQYAMMSMKTVLSNLVRHYRILPASPVRDKNEPLRVKFDIMMKHVENFELQIEVREKLTKKE